MKLSIELRNSKTKTKRRGQRKKHTDIWAPKTSHSMRGQQSDVQVDQWRIFPRDKVQRYSRKDSQNMTLVVERKESLRRFRQFREKRLHREHNQETHSCGNMDAQTRRKIDFHRGNDPTTWKAISGFWDGNFKNYDMSGCGIVIRRIVGQNWETISEITVLKVSAAMATEVTIRAHGGLRSDPV